MHKDGNSLWETSVAVTKVAAVTSGRVGQDMQDGFFCLPIFQLMPGSTYLGQCTLSFRARAVSDAVILF